MIPTIGHSGEGRTKASVRSISNFWELKGWGDEWLEHVGFGGSKTTLYDTIMADT